MDRWLCELSANSSQKYGWGWGDENKDKDKDRDKDRCRKGVCRSVLFSPVFVLFTNITELFNVALRWTVLDCRSFYSRRIRASDDWRKCEVRNFIKKTTWMV